MYIVSRCLLGVDCKYNGGNNRNEKVLEFLKGRRFISICPETAGGLLTPRPPSEIQPDGRIINIEGGDVSRNFAEGTRLELEKVRAATEPIEGAILKAKSPSCGAGRIYDGTFSGTLTDGDGTFAAEIRKLGIPITKI